MAAFAINENAFNGSLILLFSILIIGLVATSHKFYRARDPYFLMSLVFVMCICILRIVDSSIYLYIDDHNKAPDLNKTLLILKQVSLDFNMPYTLIQLVLWSLVAHGWTNYYIIKHTLSEQNAYEWLL